MASMSAIRNTCVARAQIAAAAAETVYTVPEGFVLLLKSVYMSPTAGTAWSMYLYAVAATSNLPVIVTSASETSAVPFAWEGWLALNGGDSIYLSVSGSGINYWISGALLPFTP
jgi:hypothetical protein